MAHRIERVNHLIRREISDLLQRQVKDPRLGSLVIITEVSTSSDLKYAKIFVNCVSCTGEKEQLLSALTAASGYLRNELAKRLKLRHIPELSFYWDESLERGARILELLDRVSDDGAG